MFLDEDATLEEVQAFFNGDKFATQATGCRIVEVGPGHCVAEMDIEPHHRNAAGNVMGGAIFTLADFCMGAAANVGWGPSVSVSNTIEYLSTVKGDKLIAEAIMEKRGRRLGFGTVNVRDNTGRHVAKMTATNSCV